MDTPDVVADTSYMWNQESFLAALTVHDVLIVLDRDKAEREASVRKLLGDRDWAYVEKAWADFKDKLKCVPQTTVWIDYKDLFSRTTKERLFQVLYYYTGAHTGNFEQMWQLMKNMKVTNQTAERDVQRSYFGDFGSE